jgi:hypothetical protein
MLISIQDGVRDEETHLRVDQCFVVSSTSVVRHDAGCEEASVSITRSYNAHQLTDSDGIELGTTGSSHHLHPSRVSSNDLNQTSGLT